uniref:allantoinase AllB n=1 Tax=Anaerococcus mediterraneensis TaxID=1870984 RepID=UPI000931ACBE|nr:allantoinase AllB [Anaerococcus mediterraneensis]
MYDLLVKNAKVVGSDDIENLNIYVKNGKISALTNWDEILDAEKTVDVDGKLVFPGFIDTHAHLNDPGYEWREDYKHGTRGAILGGYTTIIDMPLQNEPAMTSGALFDRKEEKVGKHAYSDYCFWGGLIPDNLDKLKEQDEKGVVSFKSFIGPVSPDYASLNYGRVYRALEIIKEFDGRAGFHCEDFSIIKERENFMKESGRLTWRDFLDSRPLSAEYIATAAVIEMAREIGCKVHICHISHPDVAQLVKDAQKDGVDVTAETCSHYLVFNENDVLENGPLFKCAPPLRKTEDMEKMWDYVLDGTFSGIASDHSPCSYDEKHNEILGNKIENVFDVWGGISGIQSSVQAVLSKAIEKDFPLTKLSKAMAENPAKAFGIYGKKGAVKVGFDADLVVVDKDKEWEITADSLEYVNKISAFVGLKGKGQAVKTILRGEIVAEDGKVIGNEGYGQLVKKVK